MATHEARLGEIFDAMAWNADDVRASGQERIFHGWAATEQPPNRNAIPIDSVVERLYRCEHLHLFTDQMQHPMACIDVELTSMMNKHSENADKYYDSISLLLHERAFVSWFQGRFSSTMILHGRDDRASYPLAYMCAALARKVHYIPYGQPISFFCQLTSTSDPRRWGVACMLKSLMAQLLAQNTKNMFVTNAVAGDMWQPQRIPNDDVEVLFNMFATIVRSITGGVIICIIDGVDRLARFDSRNTHRVMPRFHQLMAELEDDRQRVIRKRKFKLLLTFYERNNNIFSWFPNQVQELHLEEVNPGGAAEESSSEESTSEGQAAKRRAEELAEARAGKRRAM